MEYNKCMAKNCSLVCEKPMWDYFGVTPWYRSCITARDGMKP